MDYRKLCVELFGTDDEAALRKIAAEYEKKNTRNAGRKRKASDEDIRKMRTMRNAGASMQELARKFRISRQTVERYLNTSIGDGCTMRLTYMFRRQPCTVIDVNFLDRKVVIQNKTDDILHRAFGVIKDPTWNDFENFGFIENLVVFYLENSGHKITLYTKRWFALANHFFLCYNIFRYFSIFGGFLLTLNQYLL